MTKNNMPRGGLAAFGAVLAVLFGAAWYLVPRWALLWVLILTVFFLLHFLFDFVGKYKNKFDIIVVERYIQWNKNSIDIVG